MAFIYTKNIIAGIDPLVTIDNYKWQDRLKKADCVVVMYTPSNFKGFDYDGAFVYKLYHNYYP